MAVLKILIIDDDVELCEELAEILRDEGYEVENTSDAVAGLSLTEKNVYDVAILDFKMPVLSGVDILKEIKSRNPKTRIYMITGKPFIDKLLGEEKAAGLVSGVIKKPFGVEELLEMISTV